MYRLRSRSMSVALTAFLGVIAVLQPLTGCSHAQRDQSMEPGASAPDLSPAEARSIAERGFVFGLPIVMNYAVMYEYAVDTASSQYKAPFNVIHNEHRVFTWQDTAIITPNSDTPYSLAFMDLASEPIIISVPSVDPSRYYSVMLCDGNTFNYGYIGSRATGNEAGDYMVVGPGWNGSTPPGIRKVFRSTTRFSVAAFRTQLFDASDMPNVVQVQNGYKVRPLSAFVGGPAPASPPRVAFPKANAELAKTQFFELLAFAMQFAEVSPEEAAIRNDLAKLGVIPGKRFDSAALSPQVRAAVVEGMRAGEKAVEERAASLGTRVNGWRIGSAFGDRAFYNGDWLLRAAAAKAGIYGNDAAEAVYPITKSTATGEVIDTSMHDYTLTFAPGSLPPVNAFWSVTMYDGKTQLLIHNPINRYLINSPMLPGLKKNPDGSITLHIQKNSPGPDWESNWLPAPDGEAYIVMRLYWPKTEHPSVLPPGQGTWAPPAVERVR